MQALECFLHSGSYSPHALWGLGIKISWERNNCCFTVQEKKKSDIASCSSKKCGGLCFFLFLVEAGRVGREYHWVGGRQEGRGEEKLISHMCNFLLRGTHEPQSLSANMVCWGTKWRAFGYNHLSQNVWWLCLWGFGVSVLSNFFTYPSLSLPLILLPRPSILSLFSITNKNILRKLGFILKTFIACSLKGGETWFGKALFIGL